jgi:hypothetical protein
MVMTDTSKYIWIRTDSGELMEITSQSNEFLVKELELAKLHNQTGTANILRIEIGRRRAEQGNYVIDLTGSDVDLINSALTLLYYLDSSRKDQIRSFLKDRTGLALKSND